MYNHRLQSDVGLRRVGCGVLLYYDYFYTVTWQVLCIYYGYCNDINGVIKYVWIGICCSSWHGVEGICIHWPGKCICMVEWVNRWQALILHWVTWKRINWVTRIAGAHFFSFIAQSVMWRTNSTYQKKKKKKRKRKKKRKSPEKLRIGWLEYLEDIFFILISQSIMWRMNSTYQKKRKRKRKKVTWKTVN